MKDRTGHSIWTAPQPGHLQSVDDQVTPHIGLHRPTHYTAAEQIDDYGQKQQPSSARMYVTSPASLLGAAGVKLRFSRFGAIGRSSAVGGRDAEAPLAASPDAMLLHQPLHTLLAYTNALSPQLPPDARQP